MSDIRVVRKMQQLNNLAAMVTELARPGDTIVDFCSGTVLMLIHQSIKPCTHDAPSDYSHMRCCFISDHLKWNNLSKLLVLVISSQVDVVGKVTSFTQAKSRHTEQHPWKDFCKNQESSCLVYGAFPCALCLCCTFLFPLFCSFTFSQGHVGIVLAHTIPDCQVKYLNIYMCGCVGVFVQKVHQ